jgi:RNA polymerase sigma-70 factor (ECF subfamily)
MQTTADEVLIQRIAEGDRLAMQVLFGRHHVRVYRFVLRLMKDQGMAEDIVADTFLDVWRQAARFERRSSGTTWILSIARFKALDVLRKRREDSLDDEAAEAIADGADDPEVSLQKANKGEIMRACLSELSADHRAIVDLVYYHEQSVAEVAAVLGIPENTVKTRMFYARKRLSELLAARGIDRGWP